MTRRHITGQFGGYLHPGIAFAKADGPGSGSSMHVRAKVDGLHGAAGGATSSRAKISDQGKTDAAIEMMRTENKGARA